MCVSHSSGFIFPVHTGPGDLACFWSGLNGNDCLVPPEGFPSLYLIFAPHRPEWPCISDTTRGFRSLFTTPTHPSSTSGQISVRREQLKYQIQRRAGVPMALSMANSLSPVRLNSNDALYFSPPPISRRFLPTQFPKPSQPTSSLSVSAISTVAGNLDNTTIAVIGASSALTVAAVISLTDPERRRQLQASEVGGGDKEVVREYFNKTGFERWKKIYGETDDVNKVQMDIRVGHAKTVENTIKMLTDEGSLQGVTVCDAGCGTGSLSIPLAKLGAVVSASDISAAMVAEAKSKAEIELKDGDSSSIAMPKFEVKDLESLNGKFNTVICLDVLIHYPQNKADGMIAHLASLAEKKLILSFAPKTFYYNLLKRIGELFPGPSKATRAYLHAEADIERALNKVGWKINKKGLVTTQFYFANLIEAVPL